VAPKLFLKNFEPLFLEKYQHLYKASSLPFMGFYHRLKYLHNIQSHSVYCTLLFHPFCLQTLPLSFPLSLSAYYFSCTLPSLAPLSNIFLALSLPLLVPPISRSLPCTSIYSIFIISPLSLFYFECVKVALHKRDFLKEKALGLSLWVSSTEPLPTH
jgi:hypothetical protein